MSTTLPIEEAFFNLGTPQQTGPPPGLGDLLQPGGPTQQPGFLQRNVQRIPGFSDFTTERLRLGRGPRTSKLTPQFLRQGVPAPDDAGFFRRGLANPRLLGGLTRGIGGYYLGEALAPAVESVTPGEGSLLDQITGGATRGAAAGLTLGGPKGAALGGLAGAALGPALPILEDLPIVGSFVSPFTGGDEEGEATEASEEAQRLAAQRNRQLLEMQLAASEFIEPLIADMKSSTQAEANLLRQLAPQLGQGFSQLARAEAAGRETYADRAATAYAQQIALMPAFNALQGQAAGAQGNVLQQLAPQQ